MVIRASAASEIRPLVKALSGSDEVQREAAVARLAIIGPRAVEHLIEAYNDTTERQPHIAILRALEAIGDHRSTPLAREAIAAGGDVAVAGAGVLRSLLESSNDKARTTALDTLVAAVLERNNEHRLRLAALEALQDTPADVRARIASVLDVKLDRELKARASTESSDPAGIDAAWSDALEGHLPDDPRILRDAIAARAAAAPLGALQKLVDAVRAKEEAKQGKKEREAWMGARGALHQALALRGSRVALYDLRESLDGVTQPLPNTFLAALHVLGDASCLEPLAAAWGAAQDERWRQQLSAALHAIVTREKISRRHAAMKRIAARWPDLF